MVNSSNKIVLAEILSLVILFISVCLLVCIADSLLNVTAPKMVIDILKMIVIVVSLIPTGFGIMFIFKNRDE
ncbi:hypothetical protein J6C36_04290 [Methanocorpusculaceae archaeon]|nr:hypothetical protein [Methanocorpusculaceae archaeon]